MNYYDAREVRDPAAREQDLFSRLPACIAHAQAHAPAFARLLAGIDASSITSRAALARLPVTRKSALLEAQKSARPFGGFSAVGWGADCLRVFASLVDLFDIPRLRISSGGLREGVVLRELRAGLRKSYDSELVGAA